MMKTFRYMASLMLMLLLVATSCEDEFQNFDSAPVNVGRVAAIDLNLMAGDYDDVTITTRSSLSAKSEGRLHNMYVFVFAQGERIFFHEYDSDSRQQSSFNLDNGSSDNIWYTQSSDLSSTGRIRLMCPTVGGDGASIYVIANVNSDMLDIKSATLARIIKEQDLQSYILPLKQSTVNRNANFAMTGRMEHVSINPASGHLAGQITRDGQSVSLRLERLDAKVDVKVRSAVGNPFEITGLESGTAILKGFTPTSWQVCNLPMQVPAYQMDMVTKASHFDSDVRTFETKATETFTYNKPSGEEATVQNGLVNGFCFYAIEHLESSKYRQHDVLNYQDRDRRKKTQDGRYQEGQMWENAPETSTYMVIKGEVSADFQSEGSSQTQELTAEVTYYLHLGDFAHDLNDYDIKRNTHYTYTITVKGVNAIAVEVTTSSIGEEYQEPESGNTGDIFMAKEAIYTFDAHYGQRVFRFDVDFIEEGRMTWSVSTPFGVSGSQEMVGASYREKMDYKWVQFLVNPLVGDAYSRNNQPYPGDRTSTVSIYGNTKDNLMYVDEFVAYITQEKEKFLNENQGKMPEDYTTQNSAFRRDSDGHYRIYVSVFMDEYYYDKNPLTGAAVSQDYWKQFVNQPARMMHILCGNEWSRDQESSTTGSVITLRQKSIQTPYYISKPGLMTAWGCESDDEAAGSEQIAWFLNPSGPSAESGSTGFSETTNDNGLFNSAYMVGLIQGDSYRSDVRWDDYMDFAVENDGGKLLMNDAHATLMHSFLMRNRDNNGNGVIDPEEIRWYIAPIESLYGLYIGDAGLSEEGRLYKEPFSVAPDANPTSQDEGFTKYSGYHNKMRLWHSHIVSSSCYANSSYKPIILWAEEGTSISEYLRDLDWNAGGAYSVRCIRNLGMEDATSSSIVDKTGNIPEKLIKVIQPEGVITTSSIYRFDLTNVNRKSLRYYSSIDLEVTDENSEHALCYLGFETGPFVTRTEGYESLFHTPETGIKAMLEEGRAPYRNSEGYRVPNVREGALMALNCASEWWGGSSYNPARGTLVSNYWSHGVFGKNYNGRGGDKYTWSYGYNFGSVNADGTTYATHFRAVRDWNPE